MVDIKVKRSLHFWVMLHETCSICQGCEELGIEKACLLVLCRSTIIINDSPQFDPVSHRTGDSWESWSPQSHWFPFSSTWPLARMCLGPGIPAPHTGDSWNRGPVNMIRCIYRHPLSCLMHICFISDWPQHF